MLRGTFLRITKQTSSAAWYIPVTRATAASSSVRQCVLENSETYEAIEAQAQRIVIQPKSVDQ